MSQNLNPLTAPTCTVPQVQRFWRLPSTPVSVDLGQGWGSKDGCGSPSFLGRPHGQTCALLQISREALVPPPQTITTLCLLRVFCEHGSVYVWGTDVSSMPKPELDTQTCAPSAPPTRNALCAPCTFGTPTAVPRVISGHQEEVLGACGRDTQRTGQQRLSFFLILHQQPRQNPN